MTTVMMCLTIGFIGVVCSPPAFAGEAETVKTNQARVERKPTETESCLKSTSKDCVVVTTTDKEKASRRSFRPMSEARFEGLSVRDRR